MIGIENEAKIIRKRSNANRKSQVWSNTLSAKAYRVLLLGKSKIL
jgi:hypothetical protein